MPDNTTPDDSQPDPASGDQPDPAASSTPGSGSTPSPDGAGRGQSDGITDVAAPKKKGPLIVGIGVLIVAVVAAVAFFFNKSDDDAATGGGSGETVRIGVVGASDPYWKTYRKAAADEGIDIEIVDFNDYTQPNPALTAGELDLNQFQHNAYLAEYNVAEDEDLTPIGSTATYPLGLYSKKHKAVKDIPEGGTVAVPDDTTNQARGLLVLQEAGLVDLSDGGTSFSDLDDVDDSSKVKVKSLAADATASSLEDVDAAIVNNDFVEKAGLSFDKALAADDADSPEALPYINTFVARKEDANNKTYQRLVEIFQESKEVTDGLQDVSGNTALLVKTSAKDLQSNLADVEELTRKNRG